MIEFADADELVCHRCLGSLYLRATIPHTAWVSSVPSELTFSRLVPLCPVCDVHSPAAQSLLAFFAIYSHVTQDTAGQFELLVRRWIAELDRPEIDPEKFDQEIEQWRNGEFGA